MVSCAAASIFILVISNTLAQAKDNKPSPLFKESLKETLKEFDNGTVTITKKTVGCQSQTKIVKETAKGTVTITKKSIDYPGPGQMNMVKVKADVDKDHDCKVIDKVKDIIENGHHPYPTMVGSTCRGVRCNGFPTLVGSTCSVTCGTRSTCSNGRFCRHNPSPCAEVDGLDRLAKGSEKPFTFTIF